MENKYGYVYVLVRNPILRTQIESESSNLDIILTNYLVRGPLLKWYSPLIHPVKLTQYLRNILFTCSRYVLVVLSVVLDLEVCICTDY